MAQKPKIDIETQKSKKILIQKSEKNSSSGGEKL